MLVKELYLDSFRYEESSLAHYIYHLVMEQKISLDDDLSLLDFHQADHQKVAEMIEKNVLGLHQIGIFAMKMNQRDFVFIFAGSKQEAILFFTKTFQQHPMNCHEYSLDYQLSRGKEVISFRDRRREFESFPAIAGYFKKE